MGKKRRIRKFINKFGNKFGRKYLSTKKEVNNGLLKEVNNKLLDELLESAEKYAESGLEEKQNKPETPKIENKELKHEKEIPKPIAKKTTPPKAVKKVVKKGPPRRKAPPTRKRTRKSK